jgi:hypothetical protein
MTPAYLVALFAAELPAAPDGAPTWLTVLGMILGVIVTGGGVGTLGVKIIDRRRGRIDADEVFTRVAVTLVEPLRDRLERTEKLLTAEQARGETRAQAADAALDGLRVRVREAQTEADAAYREAHRLRLLVQQWHRAIMNPAATIEWLRQLVGPDEPAI